MVADGGCADDEDEGGMICGSMLGAEGRALLIVNEEVDVGMRGKGGRVEGSVSSEREGRGGSIFLDAVRRDCMVTVLLDGALVAVRGREESRVAVYALLDGNEDAPPL